MSPRIQKQYLIACLAIAVGLMNGCAESVKKYTPTADSAREALEVALEKWKEGAENKTIDDFKVPIDVFDARWQKGMKLESYEILGEEKSELTAKIFTVKMKLDDGKDAAEVKYYVVGIEPLNIFFEENYKKISGM